MVAVRAGKCCYPITDSTEAGGRGQRQETRFLWIREAGIPLLCNYTKPQAKRFDFLYNSGAFPTTAWVERLLFNFNLSRRCKPRQPLFIKRRYQLLYWFMHGRPCDQRCIARSAFDNGFYELASVRWKDWGIRRQTHQGCGERQRTNAAGDRFLSGIPANPFADNSAHFRHA